MYPSVVIESSSLLPVFLGMPLRNVVRVWMERCGCLVGIVCLSILQELRNILRYGYRLRRLFMRVLLGEILSTHVNEDVIHGVRNE